MSRYKNCYGLLRNAKSWLLNTPTASTREKEQEMLELGSVVLAILEGAASALTSQLLTRTKKPIDIRVLVDSVAKDLKEKDKEMEASISEIAISLKTLKSLLENVPEFDIKSDDRVVYRPRKGSDLGSILMRLDEEIEMLRKPSNTTRSNNSETVRDEHQKLLSTRSPSILLGLDEEITSLRRGSNSSTEANNYGQNES